MAQDEAEPAYENVSEGHPVQVGSDNPSERAGQLGVAAENQINPLNQDSSPSLPVPQKHVTLQESPNTQTEVTSPSPVTRIVKKGDTMAKLLNDVYGSASPTTVQIVLEHNPHIASVRRMYPGQEILFPPLQTGENPKKMTEADAPLVSVEDREQPSSQKSLLALPHKPNPMKSKTRPNAIPPMRWLPYKWAIRSKNWSRWSMDRLIRGMFNWSWSITPTFGIPRNSTRGRTLPFRKFPRTGKPGQTGRLNQIHLNRR